MICCISRVSSYAAALFISRTNRSYSTLWNNTTKIAVNFKLLNSDFSKLKLADNLHFRCYSTKKTTTPRLKVSRKKKSDSPASTMEQDKENDAFFVVRKGDVVGVYKSFTDCQAQAGSSVCDPPVSIFKGYSLPKDSQDYLLSRGLQNALYTIRAEDLKEDLFGTLAPCSFQQPASSEGEPLAPDATKKRSQEFRELQTVEIDGSTSSLTDPLSKRAKLDNQSEAQSSCILEFDGASKGNPGPAGAGALLRATDGRIICRLREGLGHVTNNVAEYRAVILGLKYALKKGYTNIRAKGDSKLVCSQIQGLWKVKHKDMAILCEQAKQLKDKFVSFQISHVLREYNSEADAQANLAIKLADGQVQEECF
ncbi:uncharacterized protein LOC126653784 [Mercurialis annua]|uniref:uncharacterized protein LOC126653784 n=1 Tax=Mercurialis annua TaxID=3986 RepID=UPI002160A123|nr:uncharacterized protein LOC126653784 [Mercurialis annua]